MSDSPKKRQIVPAEKTIVALDTNVVRELCYNSPTWVGVFSQMTQNGYLFSVTDVALAELANQVERGSITAEELERAVNQVETFLNADLPILPGKRDLACMAGCLPSNESWDADEAQRFSKAAWCFLKTCRSAEPLAAGRSVDVEGAGLRITMPPSSAEAALESERSVWRDHFDSMNVWEKGEIRKNDSELLDLMFKALDEDSSCCPPLSERLDLPTKHLFYQHVGHNRAKDSYNPHSKKKRNDGIDFDLYNVFLLPAFLVTIEDGFFKGVAAIDSYQKEWIRKPGDLASDWQQGNLISPKFPSEK